tara:strand:- start:210 stop:797 length:588 start_codon:yes stop_codon:yes gene_type:complete
MRKSVTPFIVMLLAGIVALAAAFTLTVNKFDVLQNPDTVLACSVNLVLDCSTVMSTWQSEVFGFPNMVIGLMAFASVITIAVLGLARTVFPRWFLVAGSIGFFLGAIFSYWLFFQSVYAIQILCPWCLLVTASTTLIFSSMLHVNLKQNTYGFKKKVDAKIQKFLDAGYHQMIVIAWLALMVALVVLKFGADLFA